MFWRHLGNYFHFVILKFGASTFSQQHLESLKGSFSLPPPPESSSVWNVLSSVPSRSNGHWGLRGTVLFFCQEGTNCFHIFFTRAPYLGCSTHNFQQWKCALWPMTEALNLYSLLFFSSQEYGGQIWHANYHLFQQFSFALLCCKMSSSYFNILDTSKSWLFEILFSRCPTRRQHTYYCSALRWWLPKRREDHR